MPDIAAPRLPFVLALCLAFLGTPAPAQDRVESVEEAFKHCASATGTPIVLIASCGSAINSGRLTPDGLAVALTVRGGSFGDTERPDLGIADLDRALGIQPDLLLGRSVRADLRVKLRRYPEAIEDLDAVLKAQPDDTRSLRLRGSIHDWLGESAAALADFSRALDVRPELETYVDRAIAWGGTGDIARAMSDLEAALRIEESSAAALFERGLLRFRTGAFAEAAADLARAADLKPDQGYHALWAYLAAARAGQGDAASGLARRAEALDLAEWPGQLVELYLGRRAPDSVAPPPARHVPWMADGYRCEADFYLAEWHLLRGETAPARTRLEAAIASNIAEFIEWRAAQFELARLK